jgi:polysaccharide biosynthesis protein PslH
MPRPRLLFLCHTLPYPPDGGPWIRTYHVLRLLAEAFDITALCFERAATAGESAAWSVAAGPDGLGRFGRVEIFPIPQRHSRIRCAWDHARSIGAGRVYTTYMFRSASVHERLRQLLRSEHFDLIHVDSLDLCDYVRVLCRDIPIVCVHHDVQSVLLRRRSAADSAWYRRVYLRYQAALMEEEERRWGNRVALNVAVSERDGALIERLAPGSRVAIVPNGVDVDEFRPVDGAGSGVAFAGGASAFPNRDALEYFCDAILPHLRTRGADVPVRWVGRASADQMRRHREQFGVELTGYVDDVRPLMSAAACHIVPLRVGGGTRLKILNSWAMGKPVVSTSIGCEGLDAIDGDNILIRDEPRAFAEAMVSVVRDRNLQRRLGEAGRATAERLYSWEAIGRSMRETYLGVARAAANQPAWNAATIDVQPGFSH